jgi:hypothetical protein
MKLLISLLVLVFGVKIAFAQQVEFLHPNVIELGKVQQGEILQGKIEFKNTGDAPVEIEAIKPSCGCTAVSPEKMLYNSGETAVIPFSIKTNNFNGLIRKSIKVIFKNLEPRTYTFFAQATIVTDLNITPKYINFYQVDLNADTVITEYFEIENASDKPIEIYKIHTDSKFLRILPEKITVPSGKSHLVRLDFIPTEAGRHNTQIYIESNLKTKNQKNLPVFIHVRNPLKGS